MTTNTHTDTGISTAAPSTVPLSIHHLTVAYREQPVLWNINLSFPVAQLCAIVGPNGAGKSTLLKSCLGLVAVASGHIRFFDQPLAQVRQRVAYVPQRTSVDWDFPTTALDVVQMGLYGRLGWFRRPGKAERQAAEQALEQVNMADFAHRQIAELSGGQQQRVFLARALVQGADLYLMDEPFAGVDATTEHSILEMMHSLKSQGRTVIVVHHDLETVRDYFDHLTLINKEVIAHGDMANTFTTENLSKAFGGKDRLMRSQIDSRSLINSNMGAKKE